MKISSRPFLIATLTAGALWNTHPAHSQTNAPAQPQSALQARQTCEIPLKNVPAHLMAWWLDPVHQPRPTELGSLPRGERAATPLPNDGQRPLFGSNANVYEVQADDAAKLLRVSGKNIDIEKVRATVKFLDQPLRYVEVETRLVQLTDNHLNRLNLNLTPPRTDVPITPTLSFVRVPGDVTTLLATLGRSATRYDASMPPTVIFSNGSGTAEFTRSHPLTSNPQEDGNADPREVRATLNLHLTPTLNNDDTITLLTTINGQVELSAMDTTTPTLTDASLNLLTIFNVKAGETIAMKIPQGKFMSEFTTSLPHDTKVPLIGDIPLTGQLFRSRANNLVVFITARPVPLPAQ